MRYLIVLLLCVCAASPTLATAQTTATIVGTVVDTQGGVLPGTTIVVRLVETGLVREVTTDRDGRFAASALPVGEYELRASLARFRPLLRTGLRLTVGETVSVTLVLEPGAAEEVTVRAEAPLVNTRSGDLSYLMDQRTIEQVPVNGRNYTDLMQLQPGVVPFPNRDNGSVVAHGLAMSVNGQDPRANVYLLDGTLLNDFTNSPAGSAAGTALGMETIREFRLESSTYSAEYGRNIGGQVNAITKSGTNRLSGSVFEFHRNETLDARSFFDVGPKPAFTRNQFGGTIGGPIREGRLFFFAGYEGLYESLGRTVVTTVPDDNARTGLLPSGPVAVNPAVLPYLLEFPRANGANLGGGLAQHTFGFDQRLEQDFLQARIDGAPRADMQWFVRYTADDALHRLPTEFPQFPRAFESTNQFLTAELRLILSPTSVGTSRLGHSRTRIGQSVESNTTQAVTPFVPGRPTMGAIDIGGIPRFGPQISADVQLDQDVYSGQFDLVQSRGRHFLKMGTLVEHYRAREFNPTFSRGIFRFADLNSFLAGNAATFIGLTPEGDVNRAWNWTLVGAYVQDDWQAAPDLTINAGLRFEAATVPVDPRDINMPDLLAAAPTSGPLYQNPGGTFSPRLGAAWNIGGQGRTSLRGGYGLYYKLNTQQDLIVTVTNPPATPRVVIGGGPSFPVPPFERAGGISVRPIQNDIEYPRVHHWNVNLQHELRADWTATVGYAGARGRHLWRNADVNVPQPTFLPDGTPFYPTVFQRPNPNFSAIELKSSDGDSWYRALILELRKRWSRGFQVQTSYTWSRTEDTTQNATFFSDSTTSVVSAMPEFIPGYNKGLSDFHAEHTWVFGAVWELPDVADSGLLATLLNDWQVATIARARSGSPLTVFIQTNWSRSQWAPSFGPGTGPDRPSYAPGRGPDDAVTGHPDRWFDPAAFVLPPQGTYGDVGRNDLIGPDLRTMDLAFTRRVPWTAIGAGGRVEVRVEIFNVFNRVNFGPPSLVAFSGTVGDTTPLASFGQVRSTITSARQVQLGARIVF
ncbi:MAG TPA: carboxypeptidase regulatory-like domain-containing protein [Vicinamibacterales bacterium]|nr:carboxypeptidase regulatory-like domain-containing protein [Vicinamibacterales bacterium]